MAVPNSGMHRARREGSSFSNRFKGIELLKKSRVHVSRCWNLCASKWKRTHTATRGKREGPSGIAPTTSLRSWPTLTASSQAQGCIGRQLAGCSPGKECCEHFVRSLGVWGIPSVGSRCILTTCSREGSQELFARRRSFAPRLPQTLFLQ